MAAPGAHVIARGDFSAGLSRSWPKGFVSSGDYRRLEFADAHVDVVAPGVEYYLSTCPVWLSATFSESRTRFNATGRTASNRSLLIQYHQQVAAPATIRLGFARGNESFAAVALDQIGTFGANTLVGGVDLRLTRRSSLGASYSYQWRSSGATQQTAGVGLSLRR
jgi:YaiO family outer membrane protein